MQLTAITEGLILSLIIYPGITIIVRIYSRYVLQVTTQELIWVDSFLYIVLSSLDYHHGIDLCYLVIY